MGDDTENSLIWCMIAIEIDALMPKVDTDNNRVVAYIQASRKDSWSRSFMYGLHWRLMFHDATSLYTISHRQRPAKPTIRLSVIEPTTMTISESSVGLAHAIPCFRLIPGYSGDSPVNGCASTCDNHRYLTSWLLKFRRCLTDYSGVELLNVDNFRQQNIYVDWF